MRAVRVHAFGDLDSVDLRPDDLPDPTPAAGEVVVRVEAIGVNPVDTYVASGGYALKPDLPYVPGAEAAGTVAAVGGGVDGWSEGDRVWVAGTTAGRLRGCYADSLVTTPAMLRELDEALSFEQGAALNVAYVTAFRALIDVAKVRPGESVLVHGATGGVGVAAVQIALAHKLDVWATGGSDAGRAMLVDLGVPAGHVLGHGDLDALPPFDVIVEMAAHANLGRDLTQLADHGRVVVVGNRGEATVDARNLMARQASVRGLTYWSGGDAAVQRALDTITAGVAAGDLRPVVQETFALGRAAEAWRAVMAGGSRGKVVLVP